MIESVRRQPSGEELLDKEGRSMALDKEGAVEAANGWLKLARNKTDGFILTLKENFDKENNRGGTICINEAGRRDYITVTQKAASGYKLVKSVYTEIEWTQLEPISSHTIGSDKADQ